jgi:hypothetical protein
MTMDGTRQAQVQDLRRRLADAHAREAALRQELRVLAGSPGPHRPLFGNLFFFNGKRPGRPGNAETIAALHTGYQTHGLPLTLVQEIRAVHAEERAYAMRLASLERPGE